MTDEKTQTCFCPNCSQPATRTGNEIACENCDAIYKISREGSRVKKIGAIKDLEDRVSKIESLLGPEGDGIVNEGEKSITNVDQDEDVSQEEEEDDEDILPG